MEINPRIRELMADACEIGMLRFGPHESPFPGLTAIGLNEADLLCIDNNTGEVVVMDHEVNGRLFCKAASSQEALVACLPILENHFERCGSDDLYFNDENAALEIREKCTSIAGGNDYASFFCSLLGV